MTGAAARAGERGTPASRRVVLRASRSRLLLGRVMEALPDRAVTMLNALAFVSLAAALLILLLL
jgi:hypothetical protein